MKPELILNIDNYDEAILHKEKYGGKFIKRLIKKCYENGFKRINWRISVCGKLDYQTKGPDLLKEIWHPGSKYLVKLLKNGFDPLEIAVEECRKYNIEIYPWITAIDEGPISLFEKNLYGPVTCELLKKHPEFQMVSKDGKDYWKGVPCYAYPEVQKHKLFQIKELSEYNIDGIFITFHSHSPVPAGENLYGYNKPVVEEYKKRYGINIMKEDFDIHLWKKIHGEFISAFLKQVKRELKRKKLIIEISRIFLDNFPFYIPWENLAEEKIIDGLSYSEDIWAVTSEWVVTFFRKFDPTNSKIFVKKSKLQGKKTKLYFRHLLWDWRYHERGGDRGSKSKKIVSETLSSLLSLPLDGIILHECYNIEKDKLWQTIKKLENK